MGAALQEVSTFETFRRFTDMAGAATSPWLLLKALPGLGPRINLAQHPRCAHGIWYAVLDNQMRPKSWAVCCLPMPIYSCQCQTVSPAEEADLPPRCHMHVIEVLHKALLARCTHHVGSQDAIKRQRPCPARSPRPLTGQ